MKKYWAVLMLIAATFVTCKRTDSDTINQNSYSGWPTYAGSKDGIRYSSDAEINPENVHELTVAWQYSTHDKDSLGRSQNQCNPIVVHGILYGASPKLKLFALDAATGREKWVFDPSTEEKSKDNDPMRFYKITRGVVYWQDENGGEARIFHNVGSRIYCIDANNGQPVRSFGNNGYIDLSEGLDRDSTNFDPFLIVTTPGIIYKDLLITGSRVSESADAAPGPIRAYDVRTGVRKWIFHTIPHPGEKGYDTWPDKDAYKKLGGANCWAGMALDEKRGIVYIPTGSVSGDFYGGIREGQDLFANCLIALDAATGKYLWHFQTVHHDLWDRDLPANPNLVTLHKNGKTIDAVAQISKQGYIFLFNRLTGKPVFPVKEEPVPQNALPGEKPWPTQPIPTLPEPFARQHFGEEDVTNLTPETHEIMLKKYRQIKYSAMFTPPGREGVWIFPGFDGGGEWDKASVDPETQVMYVNCSEMPWAMVMVDKPKATVGNGASEGRAVYNQYCFACHGAGLKGNGSSYPSLVNIGKKYPTETIRQIIDNGINMMPSFKYLSEDQKTALLNFLTKKENPGNEGQRSNEPVSTQRPARHSIRDEVPYTMTGYNRFLDDNGYPGIKPPWGTLNAVDLNSGKLLWKATLGEYAELTAKGIPPTGTENYGGPVVTKGGLVFIAATKDSKIRAFDKKTGKVLWEATLPAPGYATPAVYAADGREFVVIACGGGKIGSPSGDEYIAFALPETVLGNP